MTASMTATTQFLTVGTGRIAFDDTGGDGPLVLAIPGMGDLRAEYRHLAPMLRDAGIRLVTMDVRGFGETSPGWDDYSTRAIGGDALALVAHLDADRAVILGNSFAAGAALWAAKDAPERIGGVVLLGPIVRDLDLSPQMMALFGVGFGGPWQTEFWMAYWDSLFPTRKPADHAEARDKLQRNLQEPGRMAALGAMLGLSKAETASILPDSRVPALVVMGTHDPDFPDATAEAGWLARQIGGETLIVPGAGHYPHAEMPEDVAPRILAFVRRLTDDPRQRTTMRAAAYDRGGPARDVLTVRDVPMPEPGAGEVLVRVLASGVNPSDVKNRSGAWTAHPFPRVIPHSDGAGVIEAVGPDVDAGRVGERVWTWNAQWARPFGTAAEFVVLPAPQAVPLPPGVSFEAGACLGIPWLTAWRAVHYWPASPGVILVTGGAGAVGFYAIQLAKRAGHRVVTTVSSPDKADVARSAGADLVVDYKREDVVEAVAAFTDGRGVDGIVEVDLRANAPLYTKLLRPGGLAVAYGSGDWSAPLPLGPWLLHGVALAVFIVYELAPEIRDRAVAESFAILQDPSFKHLIAARFPLDRIVEAHEAVESGLMLGNVVVEPTR